MEQNEKEFLTTGELRRWLGIGRTKMFEMLNAQEGIPHYRIGRRILVRRSEVLDWLEEQRYRPGD